MVITVILVVAGIPSLVAGSIDVVAGSIDVVAGSTELDSTSLLDCSIQRDTLLAPTSEVIPPSGQSEQVELNWSLYVFIGHKSQRVEFL